MDPRLPCIRRKLAKVPHAALRSHSFGEEEHRFRLTPPLPPSRLDIFESVHGVELPLAYRSFLTRIGGSGASPFYGLLPLESCELFTMDPQEEPGAPRGSAPPGRRRAEVICSCASSTPGAPTPYSWAWPAP